MDLRLRATPDMAQEFSESAGSSNDGLSPSADARTGSCNSASKSCWVRVRCKLCQATQICRTAKSRKSPRVCCWIELECKCLMLTGAVIDGSNRSGSRK